jgi:hypothetical protein
MGQSHKAISKQFSYSQGDEAVGQMEMHLDGNGHSITGGNGAQLQL